MGDINNWIIEEVTSISAVDKDGNEIKNNEEEVFKKKIRKPRFEKSNMYGTVESCKKLYDEVVQWSRCDKSDTSQIKTIVYGMGDSGDDLIFYGWEGEALKRERTAINAVVIATHYLQNVLEDVLGIESEEYADYLKNDECGRYKLVDTKIEDNGWIPVGKKLPELDERVIISTKGGYVDCVVYGFVYNSDDVPCFHLWNDDCSGYYRQPDVVAWMPLPEAYRGK